jgi:hypothetical protein
VLWVGDSKMPFLERTGITAHSGNTKREFGLLFQFHTFDEQKPASG